MGGLVFTENNLLSPVLNICKKILGNITDNRENIMSYLNKAETLIWNMAFKGTNRTIFFFFLNYFFTVEFC